MIARSMYGGAPGGNTFWRSSAMLPSEPASVSTVTPPGRTSSADSPCVTGKK